MSNEQEKIIEQAIVGGLVGAGLGLLLSGSNKDIGIGALAGAAFFAALKANENALKSNIPVLIEEKGVIYEINSKGEKKIVKKIEKNQQKIPSHFKMK